jgi:hypothetical protein
MLRRLTNLAGIVMIALLGQGCGRDHGIDGTERLPTMRGEFVFEYEGRSNPLSGTYHSIFYMNDDERTLVFKGYYAGKPVISLLNGDCIDCKHTKVAYARGWPSRDC